MIRKNYYKSITESIIKAHHDTNLDSAMEDGHEMENMGKKIVAIITADPDQDLDWESEYEPFGASELTDEDEKECCEHEGIEHDTCPSCGYDVDCEGDECEDDENDDMEDIMIGGGFESEDEVDEYEDMDVKDILIDILDELKGEGSEESEDEDAFETSDENPMFGSSSDDEEDDYEDDEDEDDEDESKMMPSDDWSSEYDSEDEDEDEDSESDDEYESEEDEEFDEEDMLCAPQEQEEDDVYVYDALDNA
jgi:hypothetical protein